MYNIFPNFFLYSVSTFPACLFFSITNLPIVAKGIMRADDAVKAVQAGCAGILVSNHGARQLDGVPATVSWSSAYIINDNKIILLLI